jgi:hypothetical protein
MVLEGMKRKEEDGEEMGKEEDEGWELFGGWWL